MRQWQCGSVQKGNYCCGKDNTKRGEWKRTCHLARVYWHLGSPRSVGTPREIERSLGPRNAPSSPWEKLCCQIQWFFGRNLSLPQGQEWNLNFQLPLWSQSLQTPVKKWKTLPWFHFAHFDVIIGLLCCCFPNKSPCWAPWSFTMWCVPGISFVKHNISLPNGSQNSNSRIFEQPTLLH